MRDVGEIYDCWYCSYHKSVVRIRQEQSQLPTGNFCLTFLNEHNRNHGRIVCRPQYLGVVRYSGTHETELDDDDESIPRVVHD